MFYAEIQDGRQIWRENDFWEKSPVDSTVTLGVKNFNKIALSCTVTEINAFCVLHRNSRYLQKWRKKRFLGKVTSVDSADTLGVKTFNEIVLSHTVSEINAFMCFMQKFKMAAKNGGKMIFGKSRQSTVGIP